MLTVSVISPEKVLFDGTVDSIVAPAFDGEVGILPKHAPMMTLLGKGDLRLGQGGSAGRFRISGGFLQVLNDTVRVVTETASEIVELSGTAAATSPVVTGQLHTR